MNSLSAAMTMIKSPILNRSVLFSIRIILICNRLASAFRSANSSNFF